MKFYSFVLTFILGLIFCQPSLAQNNKETPGGDGPTTYCPPGTSAAFVYACDLAFHRKKHNCEKGFWFCFTNCGWEIRCIPNRGMYKYIEAGLDKNVFAEVSDDYVTMFFPISEVDKQLNEVEKQILNVDDPLEFELNGRKFKLITGDYSTQKIDVWYTAKIHISYL